MIKTLVVDDDPNVRFVLKQILLMEGHAVIEAECGRDALEKMAASPVELLVTDLNMPDGDGIELIESLQESPVDAPKCIVVSAASADRLELARAAGADVLIDKPFNLGEVRDAARTLVGGPYTGSRRSPRVEEDLSGA